MPLVGSIVVKNDKIIGAGYLCSSGSESPEVTAIKNSKEDTAGAVLYTNLEPCTGEHNGTGCIDFIINSEIKKIVIGMTHPHPLWGGEAVKKLKKNGIEVVAGVLENECGELNKFYIKSVLSRYPYVTLKMATTIDGKIADSNGNSKWISSAESRTFVHDLRSEYDAVMVGINTVRIDNPELTVRLVEGRNPRRVVLDSDLRISLSGNLLKSNSDKNLIIITSEESRSKKKKLKKIQSKAAEVIFVGRNKSGNLDLKKALSELAKRNIISLLIEGGSKVFSGFLKEKLFDETLVFISPKFLGRGLSCVENIGINKIGKAMKLRIKDIDVMGDDAFIRMVKN